MFRVDIYNGVAKGDQYPEVGKLQPTASAARDFDYGDLPLLQVSYAVWKRAVCVCR
ncbi:hypothetical protein [Pseudomonas aeruginosa]|uniref:hypothetical protein n=1 Tax=Pseudomonas aeruginosa TaxID=287 RepID=UPI0021B1B738|nr:hypothetical protein [Pseudomonas aeruginosa]MCT7418577.1 hypothetical protein [Pseudomonas aeruginosa]